MGYRIIRTIPAASGAGPPAGTTAPGSGAGLKMPVNPVSFVRKMETSTPPVCRRKFVFSVPGRQGISHGGNRRAYRCNPSGCESRRFRHRCPFLPWIEEVALPDATCPIVISSSLKSGPFRPVVFADIRARIPAKASPLRPFRQTITEPPPGIPHRKMGAPVCPCLHVVPLRPESPWNKYGG